MPLQLIFTSARQGLVPGRSGFCTVARHRAMPERLAQLLESLGTPHEGTDGATFTFRILEAAGQHEVGVPFLDCADRRAERLVELHGAVGDGLCLAQPVILSCGIWLR